MENPNKAVPIRSSDGPVTTVKTDPYPVAGNQQVRVDSQTRGAKHREPKSKTKPDKISLVQVEKELRPLLNMIQDSKFEVYQAEQLRGMVIRGRQFQHGKSFFFYETKDITGGMFPLREVEVFVAILNRVLAFNNQPLIENEAEFYDNIQ